MHHIRAILLIFAAIVMLPMSAPAFGASASQAFTLDKETLERGLSLSGTWSFHWGVLIDRMTPVTEERGLAYRIPENWNYFTSRAFPDGYPSFGCATFHTWIDVQEPLEAAVGLYVREVNTAARFALEYPSGEIVEVLRVGEVGCDGALSHPLWLPQVTKLKFERGRHRLIWQISNYHFDRGGPVLAPEIGVHEDLELELLGSRFRDSALIGLLLIIGLYHLAIFSQRRSDNGSFWFGLLCLAMAGRQIATSRFIEIFSVAPAAEVFIWRDRLEYLTMLFTLMTGASYFAALFPTVLMKRLRYFTTIFVAFYGLLVLLSLPHIFSAYVRVFQFVLLVVTVTSLVELGRQAIARSPLAMLTLLGFAPIVIASINDILMTSSVINTPYLTPYGFTLFILVQSYLLATRFSRAFATAERLSKHLKSEVESQTKALREQTEIAVASKAQAEEARLESDRLRLEAEKHADDLRELDRAKTEFFQNMSHELRTPLTLMLLPLERYVAENQHAPSLDMAIRNGRRLQRMVNQLLDLQKTEAGKFKYSYSVIDCGAFASVFAEYFEPAAAGKGIAFTLGRPQEAKLLMSCDVDALEKIVFNFLSNALKFTPAGGSIRLDVGQNPETGKVRWAVLDTGIGIRKNEQGKVFEVFAQADGSTTREHEGTGLGLALCKTLTEEMGGEIGVISEPGEGSEFYVEFEEVLPEDSAQIVDTFEARAWLQPDEQQAVPSDRTAPKRSFKPIESLGQLLVVDDIADMREVIVQVLEEAGYSCTTAQDGAEALSLLAKETFDLVVSDWMMPNVSGPELISTLRERETLRQTPVILLTAKSDDVSRFEALDTGADGFLGKPFKPEELLAMVRNLLLLKERELELEELLVELKETQQRMLMQAQLATVGNMAQGLAHEIRNPLNFVRGGAELLADELEASSGISAAVKLIERGIERIEGIVMHVQELAEGRQSGELSKVGLRALLSSCVEILELSQLQHEVGFQISCDDTVKLKTDERKLSQVLLNLLLNSVRALRDVSDAKVELSVLDSERADKPGLVIRVADNGPGVPTELIENIFEPFVTRTVDDSGTGLGLTLSRQMVESLGGTLELVSNEGGATFDIWLPGE